MTRVTVVVPVYNHERYVADGLRSVVDQDHADLEIVCVDDGSRDTSLGELLAFSDSRGRQVRLLPQANLGAHAALNRGASVATGELLMFLNSDDQYRPGRVSAFVRCWENLGKVADFWGFSMVDFMDGAGAVIAELPDAVGYLEQYTASAGLGVWVPHLLAFRNVALTSGNIVVTRSLFERVGGFRDLAMVHDWEMVLRLLSRADPVVIPQRLYRYRLHDSNSFKSIDDEIKLREGDLVKQLHRAAMMEDATARPYHERATPFVDFLRGHVVTGIGLAAAD